MKADTSQCLHLVSFSASKVECDCPSQVLTKQCWYSLAAENTHGESGKWNFVTSETHQTQCSNVCVYRIKHLYPVSGSCIVLSAKALINVDTPLASSVHAQGI